MGSSPKPSAQSLSSSADQEHWLRFEAAQEAMACGYREGGDGFIFGPWG